MDIALHLLARVLRPLRRWLRRRRHRARLRVADVQLLRALHQRSKWLTEHFFSEQ